LPRLVRGGGRSAAYSIGALKGLHLSGTLPKVDIISAVSGGSYAATWLYAQYGIKAQPGSSRDAVLDDVLSKNSIEEVAGKAGTLVRNLTMLGLATVQSTSTDTASLFEGGLDLIVFPLKLILYAAGVVWSYHPPWDEGHETGSGSNYERALSNAFHVKTGDETTIESNYFKSLWNRLPFSSVSVKTGPPIQTASEKPVSERLPYLVVNATIQGVRLSDEAVRKANSDQDDEGIRLADRIFEFTPYGMGSPSVGYIAWDKLGPKDRAKTYSFSRVASISGAAVDKRTTEIKGIKFLNVFGRDLGLGYVMLDPTGKDDSRFFLKKQFFVLTDGGHEENLGVYSLIKRGCKNILALDAEYDGAPDGLINSIRSIGEGITGKPFVRFEDTYQFEGYGKLKNNLGKEKSSDIRNAIAIDEIDSIVERDRVINKLSHKEREEIKEYNGSWSCWSRPVKTPRTLFKCEEHGARKGCVRSSKDSTCEPSEQTQLKVRYIKLSADRKLLDDRIEAGRTEAEEVYGPLIWNFYNKEYERNEGCKKDEKEEKCKKKDVISKEEARSKDAKAHRDFPHYSTAKFILDEDAFLAIAELGCRAVMQEYEGDGKAKRNSSFACINTDRTTGVQESKQEIPRALP
jgi:Patatin-like phospholipase